MLLKSIDHNKKHVNIKRFVRTHKCAVITIRPETLPSWRQ